MALAAEELSPAAESAVSAAAAGRGRKLTPEVAHELRRRATKPKAAPAPAESSDAGGIPLPRPGAAFRVAGRAAKSVSTPSGRSSVLFRVVLAFGAFLLALELASYLSGRYFSYSLKTGAQKATTVAKTLEIYPGQAHDLALRKVLPS